jgi:hypothetical protein
MAVTHAKDVAPSHNKDAEGKDIPLDPPPPLPPLGAAGVLDRLLALELHVVALEANVAALTPPPP